MKGVLLCKFDEERGYIPVKVYPSGVRKRKNMELFKEIARNAIGFGSQVDYQAFELSDINCLAKRFSISVTEARGGSTLYALVVFSGDSEEFDKNLLGESAERLMAHWESRTDIIKTLYSSLVPEKRLEVIDSLPTPTTSRVSRPILPNELFIEKEGFFADGHTIPRNLVMLSSFAIMFWILFSHYNMFSFSFMLILGAFIFSIISKKDKTLKIINGFVFFFIVLLFVKLTFELIGDTSSIAFLGTFPDFSRPDLALLSFFCGILVGLGLDRGTSVDKGSFIIGIGGTIFLILYFFTPVFEILWGIIGGS